MICNKCGMNNLENSNFCIGCGNDLRVQSQSPVINNQANQSNFNQPEMQNINQQTNVYQYDYGMPLVKNQPKKEKNDIFKNKKLLIIIGLVSVVIIVGIILAVNIFGNNKEKETQVVFNEDNPIRVKKNGKYGFIDTKGKEIVGFKYDYASDFINGKAIVALIDEDSTETYYVINNKGESLISSTHYLGIEYLSKYDIYIIDDALYNGNLKRITAEGIEVDHIGYGYFTYSLDDTAGIMNYKGKKIYTVNEDYIYGEVIDNLEEEYYAEIHLDDKELLVDLDTGNVLYTLTDTENQYFYDDGEGVVQVVQSEPSYQVLEWLYLRGGEIAYRTSEQLDNIYVEYPDVLNIHYGYNYEDLGKERSYYYYDVDTKEMLTELPKDYINLDDLNDWHVVNGYEETYCSGGYGINAGEKVILPCEFDTYRPVSNLLYDYIKDEKKLEIIFVEKDEKVSLYDLAKKEILYTFRASNIYSLNTYENSTFIVEESSWYDDLDDKLVYNILTGKILEVDDDDYINVYSNHITVSDDEDIEYYNTDLELIYTVEKED